MDQATQDAEQIHRVKRGRPAKAVEARVDRIDLGAWMDSEEGKATAYALRIWHGQSVDVPIGERVERIVNGLRGQGMSIDVILPHADAQRYLDKYK